MGDVGRPPSRGSGGGVRDIALGLLWFDVTGDRAGDEASGICRAGSAAPASSSDWALGSSSLSRADTKAGSLGLVWAWPLRDEGPLSGEVALAGREVC